MSEVVYKYVVPVDDEAHEVGFFPVHVGTDPDVYDEVLVWSLVDVDSPGVRLVQVFGTGQPIPAGAQYVGTVPAAQGKLIWHVFDVTDVKKD